MQLSSLITVILAMLLRSASAFPLPNLKDAVLEQVCNVVNEISFFKCKGENEGGPVENPTKLYGDHKDSKSSYHDGNGTYVSTDDRYQFSNGQCWTDLYWVEESEDTTDWKLEAKNDCGGNSSSCQAGIDNGVQTCNQWSLGVEAGAELGLTKKILNAKISAKVTASAGGSICESIGKNMRCTWEDQGCHAVWTRMSRTVDHGYIRHRCNRGGTGDITVWSKDWILSEKADTVELGCKASCDDTSYPA